MMRIDPTPASPESPIDSALKHVALRTSAAVLQLQQRADRELRDARDALEGQRAELAALNALLRATLESTADGIVVIDLSRRLVTWNSRFLSLWGLDESDLDGADFQTIEPRLAALVDLSSGRWTAVLDIVAHPDVEGYTLVPLRDGRVLECHGSPHCLDGVCAGSVLNWRDITARRRAETEQRLLEEQLRASQKMEALGVLAGGIAHDFNNLLAIILGNTELARSSLTPAGIDESLGAIDTAGHRAMELVQQILAFARRQPRRNERVDLRSLAKESGRLLRAVIPSGVEFDVRTSNLSPVVMGDLSQLQQVLMNLCTNAINALPVGAGGAGRGRIVVMVDERHLTRLEVPGLSPGRYASVTVMDDGVGMAPELAERIFEPFFTGRPIGQGTGLGLAVVHGIVSAHGGGIRVFSAPGEGTTFELFFPLAPAQETALPALPTETAAEPPSAGRSIWLVDDEPALVKMLGRSLERDGHRVRGFTDANEALAAMVAGDSPDLLVTDFNMPRRSGVELAREARVLLPGLPVVICTGLITDALARDAASIGVTRLLYKPDMPRQIRQIAQDIFS